MLGRKTGGRQKGSKNKKKREVIQRAKDAGLMPLDYMLQVMRDETQPPERRDDMAKSAAPYLHPKRTPENRQGESQTYVLVTNVDQDA